MTLNEVIAKLQDLQKDGKGLYDVCYNDSEFGRCETSPDCVSVYDNKKRIVIY